MRRYRPVSRWTAAVLVLLGLITFAGWAFTRHSVQRQDRAALETDAGQINLLLQTALQNFQSELRSVAFFTQASGNSAQVFEQQAKPLLTSPGSSVALVNTSGRVPVVEMAAGPSLQSHAPLPPALMTAVLGAQNSLVGGLTTIGGQTLLYLAAAPSTLPTAVGLETTILPPGRRTASSSGPYSLAYVNLYDGTRATPDRLITSTYGTGSLPGTVVSTVMKFGAVTWLIQVSAKSAPSGSYNEASPWIALGVGLAVALGVAVLVETLGRRREHAERLAVHLDQVAEENRRLYDEQRSLAETLQAALLPEVLPAVPAAEAAVRYLPGVEGIHVGGDWYDMIPTGPNRVLLVVGDVSGRGLRAASSMAALLYATRAYAAQGDPPATIMTKLSQVLTVESTGHFATVLLVEVDLEGHDMTVVSAGHPPPLLLNGPNATFVDIKVGPPVGVSAGASYEAVSVSVPVGSTVLAFTDGLFERRGEGIDVSLGRLRDTAALDGHGSLDGLLSGIVGSLVGEGAADDMVLLGLKWQS
ncbi:MAG TPA: PP2C family protein-serine/threonine phosphatase [Acidimicrobiales bacterium]|nr:PP2C family protein-serine/threonine phosphatase [Acidimicrobiales bacterium]